MRRFFGNIISTLFSLARFSIIKLFCINRFKFYWIERFSPNVVVKIGKKSKLTLGKRVRVHSCTRIMSGSGGSLVIEDDCKINYDCMIVCRHSIHIKKGVEFGPGVIVYDHDHDFRAEGGIKAKKYRNAPVIIGENSWIGANTVILKGTTIGNNCVIGAGCVVKGDVPDNTVLIQKRENTFIHLNQERMTENE